MKKEIIVSIVIPCYNVANLIERSYKSIANQTFDKWEAIFIDDGSTDSTYEEILKINDKRIFSYSQKNQGSGVARNKGVTFSKGKYLYFMDPDDELYNNTLEKLVNAAEKHKSEVTICGYKEIDIVTKKVKLFSIQDEIKVETNMEIKEIYSELILSKLFNPPWNKLYLTQFWKDNDFNFPNIKKGQDALLNILIFKKLSRLFVIKDSLYQYYIGRPGSAQTSLTDNDFEYFRIHQDFERDLLKFWAVDEDDIERHCLEKTINYCFSDSVKVFRYVKSNREGLLIFLSYWKKRKSNVVIKELFLRDILSNKTVFLKLLSMKLPILNYFIQLVISR